MRASVPSRGRSQSARSPLTVWGRFQLGSCYEKQGMAEEAYRQYRAGRQLLDGDLGKGPSLGHWMGEDRPQIADTLRSSFPPAEAAKAIAALEGSTPGGEKEFWASLFDTKLKVLARVQ